MSGPQDPTVGPILEALPYGVIVVGRDQVILETNAAARALLPRITATGAPPRCYELLGCDGPRQPCAHGCLARRAAESGEALPEVRIDTPAGTSTTALWLTAAPFSHRSGAVLHLRPGNSNDRRRRSEPHWIAGTELRIYAFGKTAIESGCSNLGGHWLGERPGQVLKYLICQRRREASADAIADSIWPGTGPEALNSTRHAIHRLRSRLEPTRPAHGSSSFIVAIPGGYALDQRHIWIDVDVFEQAVDAGMAAMGALNLIEANDHLARAADLYRGAFLADEPYADWAYDERSRLHERAISVLRTLVVLAREREDPVAALHHLDRLCAIEPYDEAAHHELIAALYLAGRLGDAKRRYTALARRMRQDFDKAPGFDLKSLARLTAR